MQLSATKATLERTDTIIVATVSAYLWSGRSRLVYEKILHLMRGEKVDQSAILRRLADFLYTRNDLSVRPRGR